MSEQVKSFIANNLPVVDAHLIHAIDNQDIVETLKKSMIYSLEAGGKRVRPMLLLAVLEEFGTPLEKGLDVACALEYIHTYSLIHDDLPAMDNDDLRRGKPTNHVVFGEATAILAGDALLTEAFRLIAASSDYSAEQKVELLQLLAESAGALGMVGGQLMDMEAEGKRVELEHLQTIHANKTGALLRFSILAGALLANADQRELQALTRYAEALGVLFQIQDDILDVTADSDQLGKTAGKDEAANKSTYPSLLTLEGALKERTQYHEQAIGALQTIEKADGLLKSFADYITFREN
ncbi:farnesyl-diphosphate synthase [Chryseomicrobium excrementi]|uniref:Farnesyl diphosphate synthase n=1 Tax=Chryseomicrobium excrementi TaxID=2041346 RepID=A0A2M9F2C0_9BACL|nr:farnesyl diphosphate synthase [Chryseomicrobium excrementi]PJK17610.1 farnesyl-diphosphate synthase [Chryseomicrobium excrementi]